MNLQNLVVALVAVTVTLVNGVALNHRSKRQNYDALLQNKAFVESQINCVLRRGQCDRIGNRIKILVPEVVKTKECKSCTEDEKGNVQKVADHVKSNYPKEWNEIREQYNEDEQRDRDQDHDQDQEEEDSEEHEENNGHDEDENDADVDMETSTANDAASAVVNGTSQVMGSTSNGVIVTDKVGSRFHQNILVTTTTTMTNNQTAQTDSSKAVKTLKVAKQGE